MSAEGKRQVGHAGGVHLQVLAERVGRGEELTYAMRRTGFAPRHERGRVLTDLACAIVLGAVAIADIAVLEHQRPVLTDTASASTVLRTLEETGAVVGWGVQVQSPVRPSAVVVLGVLSEDSPRVLLVVDQQPVGALGSDGAHEPLCVGVHLGPGLGRAGRPTPHRTAIDTDSWTAVRQATASPMIPPPITNTSARVRGTSATLPSPV
jgi:hypothetical protein